ncbi:hypothetical protein FRC0190_02302 [Corynebacterium rouxii]|uniref:Uncharacterized protein n=1 Tax=Corynebacterium rouxii TaxID=2719119 RepID=A0A6I8MHU8_9CORY|nr:hypothetical protein FRC0190_02173 [Corynebacterium rouxii]VZH86392.1 hypothetical protein FRC0190_02302 [Corynebacterium rouxii]
MPDTAQQTRETLLHLHYHPTGDTLNNAIFFLLVTHNVITRSY